MKKLMLIGLLGLASWSVQADSDLNKANEKTLEVCKSLNVSDNGTCVAYLKSVIAEAYNEGICLSMTHPAQMARCDAYNKSYGEKQIVSIWREALTKGTISDSIKTIEHIQFSGELKKHTASL